MGPPASQRRRAPERDSDMMSARSGAASARSGISGYSSARSGRSSGGGSGYTARSGRSTDRDSEAKKAAEAAGQGGADEESGRKKRLRVSRYRSNMHRYIHHVVQHKYFNNGIMLVILLNMIVMAIQTDKKVAEGNPTAFSIIDLFSLAVYFTEAVLKLYVAPKGYWQSGYNVFDFVILVLSIFDLMQLVAPGSMSSIGNVKFLRVIRGMRALRALRGISFIEPLQVFMSAIVRTMKSAANLLLLLFLIMYVYAIVAFNFFAEPSAAAGLAAWTSLPACLLTLFDMVTADNWSAFTIPIERQDAYAIRYLAVAFICVGHFIFTNLFIGIVVDNLDQAQEEESRRQLERRRRLRARKLKLIADKQENEVARLLAVKQETATQRIDDLVHRTVHSMRHDDIVPMASLACNPIWMQTMTMTLEHHMASLYRAQNLHFEVARTLGEIVNRRLRGARLMDGYATRSMADVEERAKREERRRPPKPKAKEGGMPVIAVHASESDSEEEEEEEERLKPREKPKKMSIKEVLMQHGRHDDDDESDEEDDDDEGEGRREEEPTEVQAFSSSEPAPAEASRPAAVRPPPLALKSLPNAQ